MGTWLAPWLLVVTLVAAGPEQAALLERLRGGTPAERQAAAERLGEVGDAAAAAGLARALHDAEPGVRGAAHAALWALWHRSGDPGTDALLQRGIVAMEEGRYAEAVDVFDRVIARAPGFAEGWNKRATVYYLMGEYDRSLADCEEVVRRNPIHFGALAGFGLNYLKTGDLDRAVRYFQRALDVNPNLVSIESALVQLRELLRQRRRDTI